MNKYVIETKQLTKTYGEQTVVNSVNIHVKQGQIYGLLGRNGAGKTTIMKMILGLTDITSGEVDVFGQNIKGREKRVYPRIGAIIETPGFYPNLTGTENLEIFAKLRGTAAPNAVKNALEIVGLPYRDKKLFSKYSRCYFGTGSQYSGCTFLYRYMDYCFYRICVHFLKA